MIAAVDATARDHRRVLAFLERNSAPLVTNWLAIGEAAHMLGDDRPVQRRFLAWTHRALTIDEHTSQDAERIIAIMAKYDDLPADLTDAALLAMCERRRIGHIASLDSDFDVYRTKARKALVNVLGHRPL
jgi:predicted nucleic acid-binding protein